MCVLPERQANLLMDGEIQSFINILKAGLHRRDIKPGRDVSKSVCIMSTCLCLLVLSISSRTHNVHLYAKTCALEPYFCCVVIPPPLFPSVGLYCRNS